MLGLKRSKVITNGNFKALPQYASYPATTGTTRRMQAFGIVILTNIVTIRTIMSVFSADYSFTSNSVMEMVELQGCDVLPWAKSV